MRDLVILPQMIKILYFFKQTGSVAVMMYKMQIMDVIFRIREDIFLMNFIKALTFVSCILFVLLAYFEGSCLKYVLI